MQKYTFFLNLVGLDFTIYKEKNRSFKKNAYLCRLNFVFDNNIIINKTL